MDLPLLYLSVALDFFLLENDTMTAVRINQNREAADGQINNEPKLIIKTKKSCRFR